MEVRRPTVADADPVRDLSACFYPERPQEPSLWRRVAAGEFPGYVATDQGAVLGFACLTPAPGFPRELGYGQIALGVAPERRSVYPAAL